MRIQECAPAVACRGLASDAPYSALVRRLRSAGRSDLLGTATALVLRPLVGAQSFLKVGLVILSRTGGWTTAYVRPIYGVTSSRRPPWGGKDA